MDPSILIQLPSPPRCRVSGDDSDNVAEDVIVTLLDGKTITGRLYRYVNSEKSITVYQEKIDEETDPSLIANIPFGFVKSQPTGTVTGKFSASINLHTTAKNIISRNTISITGVRLNAGLLSRFMFMAIVRIGVNPAIAAVV